VHGAGATWLTGSHDPALRALLGTGNPGPDWNGDARKGDNLFTCSLLAMTSRRASCDGIFSSRPTTCTTGMRTRFGAGRCGRLCSRGTMRSLVVMANRNGFFYVLDRKTGEYLLGAPYAKQTWAKGLDEKGRPILVPDMEPSEKGTLVYPSLQGSTNWSSPSYSPRTGMLYVPVREMGSVSYKSATEYRPGTYFTGGSEKRLDEESWGAVRRSTPRAASRRGLAADAAVGRRDVDRRRARVRRIERRQLLRRGRDQRQAAVAVPDRRRDPLRADGVSLGRQTTRGRLRRPRAVRVWSGVEQLRTPPDTPVAL
jgi:alcohol dehydrogenase (cytochrome c)